MNDGPTDGSAAVISACAAEHSSVILIEQPNSGVAAASNAGLDAAKEDYIWFMDSDDLIHENALSHLRCIVGQQNCNLLEIGGYQFRETLSVEEKSLAKSNVLPDKVPGSPP